MDLFTRSSQISDATDSNLQKLDTKNLDKWQEYCDLELIPTENSDRPVSKAQSILVLIGNMWQNAISALTKEPELKVWQKRDRHGNTLWHAYDPWTGDSVCLGSETEMLSWIESRYYHR
jgi:hypothetical protein